MDDDELRELCNRLLPDTGHTKHYVLDDDNNVIEAGGFGNYIVWLKNNERRRIIKQEETAKGLLSTVFIGACWHSPPLVFETAFIPTEGSTEILDRYSTYEGARLGHEMYLQKVRDGER